MIDPTGSIEEVKKLNEMARQASQVALINLDQGVLTPLLETFHSCSDYDNLQKVEEILRKSLSTLMIYKNSVNQKYLHKEIKFNPDLGIQLKKLTEQGPTTKPRFHV